MPAREPAAGQVLQRLWFAARGLLPGMLTPQPSRQPLLQRMWAIARRYSRAHPDGEIRLTAVLHPQAPRREDSDLQERSGRGAEAGHGAVLRHRGLLPARGALGAR